VVRLGQTKSNILHSDTIQSYWPDILGHLPGTVRRSYQYDPIFGLTAWWIGSVSHTDGFKWILRLSTVDNRIS
jgi:hypothetical protein